MLGEGPVSRFIMHYRARDRKSQQVRGVPKRGVMLRMPKGHTTHGVPFGHVDSKSRVLERLGRPSRPSNGRLPECAPALARFARRVASDRGSVCADVGQRRV